MTTDAGNIVYVLTNPAMPGLVKIGMTDQQDVQLRMNALYSTGVPKPFKCVIARQLEGRTAADIENALHTAFGPSRVSLSREFFEIDPEQAKAILQVMPGRDVTPESVQPADEIPQEDQEAASDFERRRTRLNEPDFLDSVDDNGKRVYERVLAMGKQEGMRVNWTPRGFSLRAACNGDEVVVCYGYPLTTFNQSIYTDLATLRRKISVPDDVVATLREKGLETKVFVPAGAELRCETHNMADDQQVDDLIDWLRGVVECIREYETAGVGNDDSDSNEHEHQE